METHIVTFEKIVGGGKALGYLDGRPCFAVGPLPGETAKVRIVKDKPGFVEAVIVEITQADAARGSKTEAHYLACSPWQAVDYARQLALKRDMILDAFARHPLDLVVPAIAAAPKQVGYRNKVEFSVMADEGGQYGLAFHERGSYEGRLPAPDGCILASDRMNQAAIRVIGELDRLGLAASIETILVRESLAMGQVLILVGYKEKVKFDWSQLLVGSGEILAVGHLTDRNRHKIDWKSAGPELIERVGGIDQAFAYDGFFQTNIAVFENILADVLAAVPTGAKILDLYGGVGTIGLGLAKRGDQVLGVEIDAGSVERSERNAHMADIRTYEARQSSAERLEADVFEGINTVVVDPPRAGLDRRVVTAILAAKPERIIYVSCNVVTQARDFALLSEDYVATSMQGYDMYPGTLHLETLMILERLTS